MSRHSPVKKARYQNLKILASSTVPKRVANSWQIFRTSRFGRNYAAAGHKKNNFLCKSVHTACKYWITQIFSRENAAGCSPFSRPLLSYLVLNFGKSKEDDAISVLGICSTPSWPANKYWQSLGNFESSSWIRIRLFTLIRRQIRIRSSSRWCNHWHTDTARSSISSVCAFICERSSPSIASFSTSKATECYFDAIPDPPFVMDVDPDPAFHFDAIQKVDSDRLLRNDADPDPLHWQSMILLFLFTFHAPLFTTWSGNVLPPCLGR